MSVLSDRMDALSLPLHLLCVWLMPLRDHSFIGGAPQCSILPLEIFTAVKAASGQSY